MKKQTLMRVLISALTTFGGLNAVYADSNSPAGQVLIQRSFVNFDFNDVRSFSSNHIQYAEQPKDNYTVKGWYTTHTIPKLIEIWKGRGPDTTATQNWANANANNNLYAELNAEYNSALYQPVCLINGESFPWNFRHARRASNSEVAALVIGKVTGSATSTTGAPHTENQIIGYSSSTSGLWTWRDANPLVSGVRPSATVNVATGNYDLLFKAMNTNNPTLGNFIDNIEIRLKPAVEFSASSDTYYEGNSAQGTRRSIPFNIVGHIRSSADMPTLKFKIEYPSNYTGSKAVYGVNYRLYKLSGNNYIQLTSAADQLNTTDPNNVTFDYKPTYSESLDYSTGVRVDNLYIEILGNTTTNDDINIPFSFSVDANSPVVATSLKACGNTVADIKFDFQIQEDDIDLSVVKSLGEGSFTVKDSLVSYLLDVENKTAVRADGVVLKDSFSNLVRVTSGANTTRLVCEDLSDGTAKTCPAEWTTDTALTNLFSTNGLSLGNIPKNAKYRFKVENLRVTDTDTTNLNTTVNTATISTTVMTDINPSNNSSEVRRALLHKADLSNVKDNAPATETGVGVFNIAKQGRVGDALLSVPADSEGKVYFPLQIKNDHTTLQDFIVKASRTSVEPNFEGTEYSSLQQINMNPFTEGLQIQFLNVPSSQCQAGVSGTSISQIQVAAQSTAQLCAVVNVLPEAKALTDIWFTIESVQTQLGDVIKNAVTSRHLEKRMLVLTNDQEAQILAGSTYVFAHTLANKGLVDESKIALALVPQDANDGFMYSLFSDTNNNGLLDAEDILIKDTDRYHLAVGEEKSLLVKVESPSRAVTGLSSQIFLVATPDDQNQMYVLGELRNVDMVTIATEQIALYKTQFKHLGCGALTDTQIFNANYQLKGVEIGSNDCVIYRIQVKNLGHQKLTNVVINDMYPAYTTPWTSGGVLPLTDSNDAAMSNGREVETTIRELLPNQEKSLYIGIRLQ